LFNSKWKSQFSTPIWLVNKPQAFSFCKIIKYIVL
jgi:hypothetical protein